MSIEVVNEPQPVRKAPVDSSQGNRFECKVRFLKDGQEVGSTKSKLWRNEAVRETRKY